MQDKFQVRVRFFAALREQLAIDERILDMPETLTIREVWERVVPDQPLPGNVLVARNMEYSHPDQPVDAGDEIAFFPPVTGG